MITLRRFVACAFALVAASPVLAGDCIRDVDGQVFCGRGSCAVDQSGKAFCARPGGDVARSQYGYVLCGIGRCAVDDEGRVKCSSIPAGGATRDSYGKVRCAGGCQDASPQLCEEATRAR
jgi:hypothetical protein